MNFNKLFFKFRIQMIIEGVLKTSLFSAMFGAIAVFWTSLVYHLYTKEASFKMLATVFGIVFAVSFLPRFLVSFLPTKKESCSTYRSDRIAGKNQYYVCVSQ